VAVSDELLGFVRDALSRGLSRGQIEDVLKQAGWNSAQVTAALAVFAAVDFPVPVPRPRPSLSARDAFMYLLLFTGLYIVAFNLGRLTFQIINLTLPDAAAPVSDFYVADSIRWSISSLIVALPVFLYMSRVTNRAVRLDANKRMSPMRRWLTYMTLFIAACVLIGDLVTLVYNLLGGELTTRFVLKALTVGVIAAAVFWYYLSDLRRDEETLKV
jgi:hypothetical protein